MNDILVATVDFIGVTKLALLLGASFQEKCWIYTRTTGGPAIPLGEFMLRYVLWTFQKRGKLPKPFVVALLRSMEKQCTALPNVVKISRSQRESDESQTSVYKQFNHCR